MATNIILQTESKSSSPITLDRLLPTVTELAIFGTSTSSVRALLICINQTVYLWLCNALAVLNLSGKEFEAHAPADNLFPLQGVNPLLVPWFPCCTLHSEINYARIYNAAYPFAHATALSAQEAGDSNIIKRVLRCERNPELPGTTTQRRMPSDPSISANQFTVHVPEHFLLSS